MLSLCTHGPRGRFVMSVVGLVALAGVSVSNAHATDWLEPRINDQDAGEFWQEAQVPVGIGELESITGRLDGGFEGPGFGAPPGVPDYQDLFLISIPIPSLFSARTVPFGFEDIDTELFLFSVTGFGLLNNDNEFGPPIFFSKIVPNATDGSFNLTAPGLYVIGVAGAGEGGRGEGPLAVPEEKREGARRVERALFEQRLALVGPAAGQGAPAWS